MHTDGIDLMNIDRFDDGFPHDWFRRLRAENPVFKQSDGKGGEFWSLVKYDDVKRVSREPLRFSSYDGTNIWDVEEEHELEALRAMMLNMDPPDHVKHRRLVSKYFTPRRIAEMQGHVREMAHRIVDRVAAKGECEFVTEVAAPLPMQTICEMVGVPEGDQQYIFDLSNKLIGFDDPEFQGELNDGQMAAIEICVYAGNLAEEVSKCPAHNLASELYYGEVDGHKLSPLEYNYFFLLLVLAGNETTRTMTAHGMRLLMEHPDERRKLVEDPSLIPGAVEEMLRYNPAVMHFRRTLREDVEIRGRQLREGDKVVLWYPSANRDEEVFEDPDRFDVTRSMNEHLAFGVGEHFCLGASLARLQLTEIFTALLARLPDMEPAGPIDLLHGNFVDGVKSMPVRFTPERGSKGTAA